MLSDTPWAANPNLVSVRSLAAMVEVARQQAGVDAIELTEQPADGPDSFGRDALAVEVLWTPRWDRSALLTLGSRLGPHRLLFLEPSIDVGVRGLGQRAVSGLVERRHGIRYDRDVPAQLRRAGFLISHLDRFAVSGRRGASYVFGEATIKTR